MRLQTYFLINIQIDSKKQLKDVKDLFRFKWEEIKTNEITVPDWEQLQNEIMG